MRTFVVLTVITLFALSTARCADAGVMLGESPAVITQDASSLSADLTPLQQEEQKRCGFRQSELAGMSGFSPSASQTLSQSAATSEIEILAPQPTLSGASMLANSILPQSPVFDGLLKPS